MYVAKWQAKDDQFIRGQDVICQHHPGHPRQSPTNGIMEMYLFCCSHNNCALCVHTTDRGFLVRADRKKFLSISRPRQIIH